MRLSSVVFEPTKPGLAVCARNTQAPPRPSHPVGPVHLPQAVACGVWCSACVAHAGHRLQGGPFVPPAHPQEALQAHAVVARHMAVYSLLGESEVDGRVLGECV